MNLANSDPPTPWDVMDVTKMCKISQSIPFTQHSVDDWQALQVFCSLNCKGLIQRGKPWKPSHDTIRVSGENARHERYGSHRAAGENLRTEGFMADMLGHLLVYYISDLLSLVMCSPERSHKRQKMLRAFKLNHEIELTQLCDWQ